MKIIISHDVDHLFGSDHLLDLIYPKLWVRSTLEALNGKLPVSEWKYRMLSPFQRRRNRISEVLKSDIAHGIKPTFFFGVSIGLGMSYLPRKAAPVAKAAEENGACIGIHGIEYTDFAGIASERETFRAAYGHCPEGIRMHYVRLQDDTLEMLSKAGYSYDSSEFDKQRGYLIKRPYKIGGMWEFPLTIMDGYLPYRFEDAKKKTLDILQEAEETGLEYITVLFHDYTYDRTYGQMKRWYDWLSDYLSKKPNYEFASFTEAINELEGLRNYV